LLFLEEITFLREPVLSCRTPSRHLLSKLAREADEAIEQLKQYIMMLRSYMHQYVPVKGDAVDEALADYVNTAHDKTSMKVMFVRMNPGVYQFGSKKICIKVE
jgi:hypothetical protein